MCGIYSDKYVQHLRFLVLSYCKSTRRYVFFGEITLFCLMITLVFSEELADIMVYSVLNRPFYR